MTQHFGELLGDPVGLILGGIGGEAMWIERSWVSLASTSALDIHDEEITRWLKLGLKRPPK